jgi:transposase-like protein
MADTRPRRCKRNPAWNREQGRQHVEAQAESGLSVQDYCFAHGLPVHTFHNWRRRLKQKTQDPDGGDIESRVPAKPVFAEVLVVSPECLSPASVVEVVLRGERRLRVELDLDEETLRRLVALLESLPC